jgi:hypothetical protein
MERNDIPGNGAIESSWHTCLDLLGTRIYWDFPNIFDLGTPNYLNLSDESDADLLYFISREQELLAEKQYAPDLEGGQDDGLIILQASSSVLPDEPSLSVPEEPSLNEEEEDEEGGNEIIDVPETIEIKTEEPVVLESQGEEESENNLEQEVITENQTTDNVSEDVATDSDDTEQDNVESNEIPETI